MHHDIAGIDQHPVGLGHSFYPQLAMTLLLQLLNELIGNGVDVPVGTPRGDNHAIGNRGLAGQINGHDVFGLGIFQLGANGGEKGIFRLAGAGRAGFRRA